MFEYEDSLPLFFCGKHVDNVSFRCVVECDYDFYGDECSYAIKEIYVQDYNGDDFEPAGENYDMVKRMILDLHHRKLQDITNEKFGDAKDFSDDYYEESRDCGVYA